MIEERDHYVLVPDPSRSAVLVASTAAGTVIPLVRGPRGAAGVVESLHHSFGLDTAYLRTAHLLRDEERNPTGGLHELDSAPPGWRPPSGTTWLGLEHADARALAPAVLRDDVERWIAEQRGATIPAARPPWAGSGWLAEAISWIEQTAAACGCRGCGKVELVAQWPLSSVHRLETDAGYVFFKAVFSTFRHEPAVTGLLARHHPAWVPEVLAVDEERGWMLMRELRGAELGEMDVDRWSDALRVAGSIHREWVGRTKDLFAVGAHDRTLAALAYDMPAMFDAVGLSDEERYRLEAIMPALESALEDLTSAVVPETLVHGDLHPWNAMATESEVRIFDWSDASVSHPFFDLPTFLVWVDDADARELMLTAYFDSWTDVAGPSALRAIFELAQPLAYVNQAISYVRISEALEPADRWFVADELQRWVIGAVGLAETLGESRPY